MKKIILSVAIAMTFMVVVPGVAMADDYYQRQSRQYAKEAEYYQRQASSYLNDAEYYKKIAMNHISDAEYYVRTGDASRARTKLQNAQSALSSYESKMRYYKNAKDKAADYLRRSADAARK